MNNNPFDFDGHPIGDNEVSPTNYIRIRIYLQHDAYAGLRKIFYKICNFKLLQVFQKFRLIYC